MGLPQKIALLFLAIAGLAGPAAAQSDDNLGNRVGFTGVAFSARALIQNNLSLLEKERERFTPMERAAALEAVGRAYLSLSENDQGIRSFYEGLNTLLSNPPLDEDAFCSVACNLTNALLSLNQYDQAGLELVRAMAYRNTPSAFGNHFPHWRQMVSSLISHYRSERDTQHMLEWLEQLLSIDQIRHGNDSKELLPTLGEIAALQRQRRDHAAAELTMRRIAQILRIGSSEQTDIDAAEEGYVDSLEQQRKYAEAAAARHKLLIEREQRHGPRSVEVVVALRALGRLHHRAHDLPRAIKEIERAEATIKQLSVPDRRQLALALREKGRVLQDQQEHEAAQLALQEALELFRQELGRSHPEVAVTLHDLARLFIARRLLPEAEEALQQAVAISQSESGKAQPELPALLRELGTIYWLKGNTSRAEAQYREALRLREAALAPGAPDHPDVAESLNHLATLLWAKGLYNEAQVHAERALKIMRVVLPAGDLDLIAFLNGAASVHLAVGRYEEASRLYQEARQVAESASPRSLQALVDSLYNLGLVAWMTGRHGAAEQSLKAALELQKKELGAHHPSVAETLEQLAELVAAQGRHVDSLNLLKQVQEIRAAALGTRHPDYVMTLTRRAKEQLIGGDVRGALVSLRTAFQAEEEELRGAVGTSARARWLSAQHELQDLAYSLALERPADPEAARLALQVAVLRKGRSLELRTRSTDAVLTTLTSTEAKERYARWRSLVAQRESLLWGEVPARLLHGSALAHQLDALRSRARLEQERMLADAPQLELEDRSLPGIADIVSRIAAELPPGGALIELVRFNPVRTEQKGKKRRQPAVVVLEGPRYLALVLRADRRIVPVDLGPAASLHQALARFRQHMHPALDIKPSAEDLYHGLFAPLLPALGEARSLIISPDGELHFLPFAALHDGSTYLIDRYLISYAISGRSLLRQPSAERGRQIVIFADPDFSAPLSSALDPAAGSERTVVPGLAAAVRAVQRLKGTRNEAILLQRRLPRAQVFTERTATEEQVRAIERPAVLHLATHGVFLPADSPQPMRRGRGISLRQGSTVQPSRVVVSLADELSDLPGSVTDNPLSRSALLLSGATSAEHAATSLNDGILTAEELQSMDLRGTQLAVLSACESGLGVAQAGDGVVGLRQAPFMAGAETLVASLWPIKDQEAGELMDVYYAKLTDAQATLGRIRALHEAMRTYRSTRPHPYYWAPFIAIGRDDPLRLQP